MTTLWIRGRGRGRVAFADVGTAFLSCCLLTLRSLEIDLLTAASPGVLLLEAVGCMLELELINLEIAQSHDARGTCSFSTCTFF